MGRRWTARGLSGERYCGDMGRKQVHDLDHENAVCHIDEILHRRDVLPFRTLENAHALGYLRNAGILVVGFPLR